MSHSEVELRQLMSAANTLDYGEAQCAQLEDVVRHADAGEYRKLALAARRSLAYAYSVRGLWDRAFPLLARCLSEFDSHPEVFDAGDGYDLRSWYCWVIQSMPEFPNVSLAQIHGALDDAERRYRAAGQNLREIYEVRRAVAHFTRDWDTEEHYHRLWQAAGSRPGYVWDYEIELERLLDRGDAESLSRAYELAAPVLAGDRTFSEPPVPIQCHMLVPLVRAGKAKEALLAYRRSRRAMATGVYRIEYFALQIEFLARTGNLDAAMKLVDVRVCLARTMTRLFGVMWFHVATAVLARQFVEAGRGAEVLDLSCGHASETVTAAALYESRAALALDLARQFDARNGNSGIGDAVRRRLEAPRLADVPLSRLPRQIRVIPEPASLTPVRNLELAEHHHRMLEPRLAKRFLEAASGLPAEFEPRRAELAAELAGGPSFDADMRAAVAAYQAAGDEYHAHRCRLRVLEQMMLDGEEQVALDYLEKTLPTEEDVRLRAHAELLYGRALGFLDRSEEKTAALARARELAEQVGDAILSYNVALQEYHWAVYKGFAADVRLAAARRKLAAAMATGSLKRVTFAVSNLLETHTAAGTLDEFDTEIAGLIDDAVGDVRAGLEYGRACRFIESGREAAAVAPLEAVISAERPTVTIRRWHMLARSHAAAGATLASIEAAEALGIDELDGSSSADLRRIALEARALIAEGYVALGEWDQALPHLAKLAARVEEPAQRAQVLAEYADALLRLDRPGDAAEQYRDARLACATTDDMKRTARCATAYVRCLLLDDRLDEAVDAMPAAEETVRAYSAWPSAPGEWRAWAEWHRVGAQVLGAVGRGPEAVALAGHAATEFRQTADELAALEMDAVAGRILLGDNRADLAEPILRAALETASSVMPTAPITPILGDLCADALDALGRPHDAATLRASLLR